MATDTLNPPLISVVTPVRNGARYLDECIGSVLAQSYPHLEHVIVDNASDDGTHEIAMRHAERDARVRVTRCREFLPVVENWNRALEFVSPPSRYVVVLPADDTLTPDALRRMVKIASDHPCVGVVSALRVHGDFIECAGLPTSKNVFPGPEIVRLFLREEVFALGPNGTLIRRDLIDANKPFFPPEYLHADTAALLAVLDKSDLGFVHEILMFCRVHQNSVTARVAERKGTLFHDHLLMLKNYGPRYMEPRELAALEARFVARYYRFLVRSAVMLRGREFFAYHLQCLEGAGHKPGFRAMTRAVLGEMGRAILHPRRVVGEVATRLGSFRNRAA